MNVINATIRQVTTCIFHKLSHASPMKSAMNPAFHLVSRRVLFGLAALSAGLVFSSQLSAADPGKLVVQVDKPGAKISPMFYGLMTEEINYSYDGGRMDISQLLADMKPAFLRFPGGLTDVNSVSEPMKVAPQSSTIAASAKFVREFPGHTVSVIRFSTK